jgi:SOS-response transcriptional repressor LexA
MHPSDLARETVLDIFSLLARLQAENPAFADMQLTDGQSFEVWGVITRSIRTL